MVGCLDVKLVGYLVGGTVDYLAAWLAAKKVVMRVERKVVELADNLVGTSVESLVAGKVESKAG